MKYLLRFNLLSLFLCALWFLCAPARTSVPAVQLQSSQASAASTEAPPATTIIEKKRFIDFAQLRDQEQQLITLPRTKRLEILMPGDKVEITLYEKLPVSEEKRTEIKRVDDSGTVFIYPLGKLFLAGLSLNEARDLVTRSMESYIINPFCEIALLKREYEPHVFVFGEAMKCGSYPLKIGDRLLDIISRAGGPTSKAYTAKITIVRLYGDSIGVMSINLNSILKKGQIERNIIIQDQDIVYLPESLYSNIKEILTTLGTVLPWYYFMKNF